MKRIIPHLATGRDGRLTEPFRPHRLNDPADPLSAASALAAEGADELAIDGRATPFGVLTEVVTRIAASLDVPITVQAEPENLEQAGRLLGAGVGRIAVRSRALDDPDLIATLSRNFGSQSIGVAIHAVHTADYWRVVRDSSAQPSEWDAVTWARVAEAQGAGELVLSCDAGGKDEASILGLISTVSRAVDRPVAWFAAVGGMEDLFDALMIGDADAVIVGDLLRSGRCSIPQLKAFLAEHGLSVNKA